MLDHAYTQLPEKTLKKERFEMPFIECFQQGTKTIVVNFAPVIKALNRDLGHAMKFITKQTAVPAQADGTRLILKGRFSPDEMQKLVNEYITRFVLCSECSRPYTKIIDQKGVKLLKCEACGAHTPVRG